MRNACIETLFEVAKQDKRIVLIVGDLGFGVVTPFQEQLPRQFVNAGVAEQNMTSMATGMALSGKIAFTYSIGNFPTLRCLEQLRNDVCYHNANVKVISVGGGFAYGAMGPTHHAIEDMAAMRALPGMMVVAPRGPGGGPGGDSCCRCVCRGRAICDWEKRGNRRCMWGPSISILARLSVCGRAGMSR